MSAEGDSSFWTWMAGAVATVALSIVTGTWAASRKVTIFEATQAKHDADITSLKGIEASQRIVEATQIKHTADITALKLAAEGHATFCAKQKEELLEAIRKEICSIVKLAIKDMTIDHHASIASLDKNIALIAQSNEQMEAHIIEIFNRLNRRDTDNPSGKERRGHSAGN